MTILFFNHLNNILVPTDIHSYNQYFQVSVLSQASAFVTKTKNFVPTK